MNEIPIIYLSPIGWVRSERLEPVDDHWESVSSRLELDLARYSAAALSGLETFSHVEILFFMNQVDPEQIETGARHPRGNLAWPRVGIFAQRAKNRPNRLGSTVCQILRVEGATLYLKGLDAIDGTPVLDIKPWVQEFAPRGPVRQPLWISDLMKDYWK